MGVTERVASVRILHDDQDEIAVLYDDMADETFGPVFHPVAEIGEASVVAEEFLAWLDLDPRDLADLQARAIDFCYLRVGEAVTS